MSTTETTYRAELHAAGWDAYMTTDTDTEGAVETAMDAVAARVLADARVFLRERLWAIAAGELAEWAEAHGIDLEAGR